MRSHTSRLTGLLAIFAFMAGAPAAFGQDQPVVPRPAFKSRIEVVALGVTVTDKSKRFVSDLSPADFVVTEDGVPQRLTFFGVDRVPVDLAILLDTSSSMKAEICAVREAALRLVRGLRPGDRGTIVEVKNAVRVLQPLTPDISSVEAAVQATEPGGHTALFTAVYVTLNEFDRQRQSGTIRRQAMVVLSDGYDTASCLSFEDVLERARRSGVTIYFVSLEHPEPLISPEHPQEAAELQYAMRRLTEQTGGSMFHPLRPLDLVDACSTVAKELAAQYTLGYVSTNQTAGDVFRRISVSVLNHPGLTWRSRLGYYARPLLPPANPPVKH